MRNSLDNFIRTDNSRDEKRCLCFGISDNMDIEYMRSQINRMNGGVAIICLSGRMQVTVNDNVEQMKGRDIITFFSGDMFSVDKLSEDFKGFVIIISRDYITNVDAHISVTYFLHSRSQPILTLPEEDMSMMEVLCTRLETFTKEENVKSYFREIMQCVIMIILYVLCELYENQPHAGHVGHFRDEELFTEFLHLVEESCRKERMLGFYAQRLSITPKHLSSSIKRVSGRSGAEWIDYIVIQNVKRTLKTTSMTISQVADYYNFPNPSFFGKYFKKHTGLTPRRFKAMQ